MKLFCNALIAFFLVVGLAYLFLLSSQNRKLLAEVEPLEAELGLMKMEDLNRAYFIEIEKPEVPSEIAKQLDHIWQFRCYLPPLYDLYDFIGMGRVAKKGVYYSGSYRVYGGRSGYRPFSVLVTIALSKKGDYWDVYYSYGGNIQTSKWRPVRPDLTVDELVVQKLVSSRLGMRSFDADTILPLLKLYDANTTVDEDIDGKIQPTYDGIIFSIYPKKRASDFEQLLKGVTPQAFAPDKLAVGVGDD